MKKRTISHTEENVLTPKIISPLLAWYQTNRRPLPWRISKDPYRIWLSEIMLQQTRIEAVIPYYHRFLSELPTIEALASVSDERLMKLWEGLGYYSRARNLKAAACRIMSEHNGKMPEDYVTLRSLNGIGDYTAGAIASIAFGKPEPAVDGNVLRVIMRLTGREDDISQESVKKAVREWLRQIYPTGEDAGNLTEALMELGENICIPAGTPKCAQCPLAHLCMAKKSEKQTELPKKSPKKDRKTENRTVLLLICGEKVAIRKRSEKGLLANLWEFPNFSGALSHEELLVKIHELGLQPLSITPCGSSTHVFTHITWNMEGMAVICEKLGNNCDDFVWCRAEDLTDHFALPGAFRAYLKYFLLYTDRLST